MCFLAALTVLLSVAAVQGSGPVICSQTQVCAVTGSAVTISCRFSPPTRGPDAVLETLWFLNGRPVGQRSEPDSAGRVQTLCGPTACTLRLTDLRESDSGRYRFWFRTDHGSYSGSPGVNLTVTALQVQVIKSENKDVYVSAELSCGSSCSAGHHSFIWIRNGEKTQNENRTVSVPVYSGDTYSCALEGFDEFPSPSVYPPLPPSVSVSPSAEVVEGSSVTLTCSSDANPAASYSWWNDRKWDFVSKDQHLVFSSIQSSDCGRFFCRAENQLGQKWSEFKLIDVKYPPLPPSVSVSPSAEVQEGSSVTLTCSSDANPAASYSWYKEDQPLPLGGGARHHFISISSEDKGIYYCKAENRFGRKISKLLSLNVHYPPLPPSVSVSPSAEVQEGSSVTLTCSSDANPAASYSWYKEDEESPRASGQNFIITDVRPEHSGNYSCRAENTRGRQSSTVHLEVKVPGLFMKVVNTIKLTLEVLGFLLLLGLCLLCLWKRRKMRSKSGPKASEAAGQRLTTARVPKHDLTQTEEMEDIQ